MNTLFVISILTGTFITFWLILDFACWIGLITIPLSKKGTFVESILPVTSLISLMDHIYRDDEFNKDHTTNRFLINQPLFVANNIRLSGLLLVLVLLTVSWERSVS
jgi:hypothetical protein